VLPGLGLETTGGHPVAHLVDACAVDGVKHFSGVKFAAQTPMLLRSMTETVILVR